MERAMRWVKWGLTGRRTADAVIDQHRPAIFRLALAITNSRDAAEDVTQEVTLRISRSIETLAQAGNQAAWIRRVTVRCAIDQLNQRSDQPLVADIVAPHRNPEMQLAVGQTLTQLSPEHRTILALAFFEQLSHQEISDLLEIPIGSVASRIHYAKERFRIEWEKP